MRSRLGAPNFRPRDKLGRASEEAVQFMCSRNDPFSHLFLIFALLPRKPEIWCLFDCLTTTYSGRLFFSRMLSLHKCSAKTCKPVQHGARAGTCPSGVMTATWDLDRASAQRRDPGDVEPAATVERAASSMGRKAGWSRLGAVSSGRIRS